MALPDELNGVSALCLRDRGFSGSVQSEEATPSSFPEVQEAPQMGIDAKSTRFYRVRRRTENQPSKRLIRICPDSETLTRQDKQDKKTHRLLPTRSNGNSLKNLRRER